ncbi:MAG: N-acetylmuramoyl-L-alanine amidase [Clostridia bacterium]|nr:N-acetylmuramoyl-L-alanine amidase [Clostridia bacterium]
MKKKNLSAVFYALSFCALGFVLMSLSIGLLSTRGDGFTAKKSVSAEPFAEADSTATEESALTAASPIILIDAGHGGEDGGASSADGVTEKDLNLSLSRDIAHLCLIFGIPYEMTRDDDTLLYDRYGELESYEGRKKSLDLKNRLRMAEELNTVLFLSIHMNKFPSPSVKGFQVYYSNNSADSRPLAESMQGFVKSHVQPYNERLPKASDSSIYLLKNIQTTALLAECGFLSNAEEAASLNTPAYRVSLAATIFVPAAEYYVRNTIN